MKFTKREVPMQAGVGASNFLKLSDGQSVPGVFRGEVYEFWQKWPRGGQKETFDVPTPGSQSRFRVNFIVHENGKFQSKVFEFGLTVYNMLAEIAENLELEKTKVKISRKGSDKNTQWIIIPLGPIDPKAVKDIAAVELVILNNQSSPPAQNSEEKFNF